MTDPVDLADAAAWLCPTCGADLDECAALVGGVPRICGSCLEELPIPAATRTWYGRLWLRRRVLTAASD